MVGTRTLGSMAESPPDDELSLRMLAVVAGDRDALFELYDLASAPVLHTARRVLGDGLDADEIVVETFEQAWLRRAQFDARRGSALRWLLTIARSRAVDRKRELAGRRRHEEAAGSEPEHREEDPSLELERTERHAQLEAALATLTPVQRRYLRCSFLEGATHHEIARRHDAPLGTVKSTIRRALEALRGRLGAPEDTIT